MIRDRTIANRPRRAPRLRSSPLAGRWPRACRLCERTEGRFSHRDDSTKGPPNHPDLRGRLPITSVDPSPLRLGPKQQALGTSPTRGGDPRLIGPRWFSWWATNPVGSRNPTGPPNPNLGPRVSRPSSRRRPHPTGFEAPSTNPNIENHHYYCQAKDGLWTIHFSITTVLQSTPQPPANGALGSSPRTPGSVSSATHHTGPQWYGTEPPQTTAAGTPPGLLPDRGRWPRACRLCERSEGRFSHRDDSAKDLPHHRGDSAKGATAPSR